MSENAWILFVAQLPAKPSSLRVNVWRRLRNAGAASLQNGVWILPGDEENRLFMERLLGYVKQNRASGQLFGVHGLDPAGDGDILARFETDREQEYDEFLEQCQQFLCEIEKETQAGKFTFAELEESEQNLRRLRRWIAKIQKRDFFQAAKSAAALAAFQRCHAELEDYTRRVYAQEGIHDDTAGDISPLDEMIAKQEDDQDLG